MKVMLLLFFLLNPCLSAVNLQAQSGCTDPQALNFNANANSNDGSCLYPATAYSPRLTALLPANLEECSGLAFFENRLWTHEDGGNGDRLYIIDTLTAASLQTVTIANADNLDWEDLAEDGTYLYIGDFGNNTGDRTNLRILRLNKSNLLSGSATPATIHFSYSDQTDFNPAPNANNYDCEAFFFWNDSLHLFSKNWLDFKTRHYALPATPGTHVAQLRDSFNVQGQITGADITADGKAVLLGYNVSTSETFLWLLFDFPGSRFFGGNKRKVSLGSALVNSQPEGICFRNDGYGYICSERFSVLPQKLLSFGIGQWTETPTAVGEMSEFGGIRVSPNPFQGALRVGFSERVKGVVIVELADASGRVLKKIQLEGAAAGQTVPLETEGLPAGAYWLSVQAGGRSFSKMLFKN